MLPDFGKGSTFVTSTGKAVQGGGPLRTRPVARDDPERAVRFLVLGAPRAASPCGGPTLARPGEG